MTRDQKVIISESSYSIIIQYMNFIPNRGGIIIDIEKKEFSKKVIYKFNMRMEKRKVGDFNTTIIHLEQVI